MGHYTDVGFELWKDQQEKAVMAIVEKNPSDAIPNLNQTELT